MNITHEEYDMTEPTPEAAAVAVKEPRATIARDERVLAVIAEAGTAGLTRKQVVAAIHEIEPGTSASQGYLTLSRLRAAGKIVRTHVDGEHRWSVVA
jgi:Fe2+ or Zn2+ uptake regulation protein